MCRLMCVCTRLECLHMLWTASHVARLLACVTLCAPTEVVADAANGEFANLEEPPAIGSRKVDIWSACSQGGTFDRVKERCGMQLSVAVR